MLFYRTPLAPKCPLRSGSNMPITDTYSCQCRIMHRSPCISKKIQCPSCDVLIGTSGVWRAFNYVPVRCTNCKKSISLCKPQTGHGKFRKAVSSVSIAFLSQVFLVIPLVFLFAWVGMGAFGVLSGCFLILIHLYDFKRREFDLRETSVLDWVRLVLLAVFYCYFLVLFVLGIVIVSKDLYSFL
jgi:hypothetical protein